MLVALATVAIAAVHVGAAACVRITTGELVRRSLELSIPFLVETAQAVLRPCRHRPVHLVGHSIGGLTALMLAHREPERVLSFIDIEGNLAPEDCLLGRQVVTNTSCAATS